MPQKNSAAITVTTTPLLTWIASVRRFGQAYGGTRIDLPMMGLAGGVVFPECPLGGSRCHLTGMTDFSRPGRLTPDLLGVVHPPAPASRL